MADPVVTQAQEQEVLANTLKSPTQGGAASGIPAGSDVPARMEADPALRQLLEESIYTQTGQDEKAKASSAAYTATAAPVRDQVNQNMSEVDAYATDLANTKAGNQPPAKPANEATLAPPTAPNATTTNANGLTTEQQSLYDRQQKLLNDSLSAQEADIRAQVASEVKSTEIAQRQTTGAARVQLAAMGALNVSTAGVQYMSDLDNTHRAAISKIIADGERAVQMARVAKDGADLELLSKQMDTIRQNKQDIIAENEAYMNNILKMGEIAKMQRDNASETIGAMVDAGLSQDDLPDGYLDTLDKAAGYAPGTSSGLMDMAKQEAAIAAMTAEQDRIAAEVDMADKLVDLLGKLPVGEVISIGGVSYSSLNKGTVTTGTETASNGDVYQWSYNQDTGKKEMAFIGNFGNAKYTDITSNEGAIVRVFEDGTQRVMFNPNRPNGGVPNTSALQEVFPEGYKPTDAELAAMGLDQLNPETGGIQCGQFYRFITGYDGPSLSEKSSKAALIDPTIGTTGNPPQAGDAFIQEGGSWDHIGAVLGSTLLADGSYQLEIVDANRKGDGVIRYGTINSRSVKGFGRPTDGLRPEFQFGTDASVDPFAGMTFGDPTKDEKPIIEEFDDVKYQWDAATKSWISPTGVAATTGENSEAEQEALKDKLALIEKIKNHRGLPNSVGSTGIQRFHGLAKNQKNEFVGLVQELTNQETLDQLIQLKKQGGALGALSDSEGRLLKDAASRINNWAITDDTGKVIGYQISNNSFLEALAELEERTTRLMNVPVGGSDSTSSSGTIRVRDKATGQTGTIPAGEFNASEYEKI